MKTAAFCRILALILSVLCVIPLAAACGSPNTPDTGKETAAPGKETSGGETGGEPKETEAETVWYTADQPEGLSLTKPDGTPKEFNFLAFSADDSMYWHDTDFTSEAMTGDTIGDAVYERHKFVEEENGILLTIHYAGINCEYNTLVNSVSAGDDDFQAAYLNTQGSFTVATMECLAELNELGTIQLDAPWWDQNCLSDLSILGQNYALYGDFGVMYRKTLAIVSFNKKILSEKLPNAENLYELQATKQWTVAKMADLVNSVSEDLDGDGEMTDGDLYGLTYQGDVMPIAIISCGIRFVTKNDDDIPVFSFNTDRTLDAMDLLADLLYDTDCARSSSANPPKITNHGQMFQNGGSLFDAGEIHSVINNRAMENDFGVLCMPLFDENQDNYYTCINPHVAATLVVPNSVKDPAFVGYMLDALAAAGKNYLEPAFYDKTLQGKSVRDEDSRATLDIIFAHIRYDLGYLSSWGISELMRGLVDSRSLDFSSRYRSEESSFQSRLDQTIRAFEALAG